MGKKIFVRRNLWETKTASMNKKRHSWGKRPAERAAFRAVPWRYAAVVQNECSLSFPAALELFASTLTKTKGIP
jgi:hypothetical protein